MPTRLPTPRPRPKPLKLALIGAGPSAFYVVSRVLQLLPKTHESGLDKRVRVDVYDRLWAPFGLVRYGVAPDHPEVKNVTHKFDATAQDSRFRFFGNVEVFAESTSSSSSQISKSLTTPSSSFSTVSLPFSSLLRNYTHVVVSTGCGVPRVHPTICVEWGSSEDAEGSDKSTSSPRVVPALSVVHWYSSHPGMVDFSASHSSSYPAAGSTEPQTSNLALPPNSSLNSKLTPQSRFEALTSALASARHITIIGLGNVSLDIARILLSPPEQLRALDVHPSVVRVVEAMNGIGESSAGLSSSSASASQDGVAKAKKRLHISIVGRRGWEGMRFGAKELREMMKLQGVAMVPPRGDPDLRPPEEGDGKAGGQGKQELTRQQKRLFELLRKGSETKLAGGDVRATWELVFGGDAAKVGDNQESGREGEHEGYKPRYELELVDTSRAKDAKTMKLETDLVITSLGYTFDAQPVPSEWMDNETGRLKMSERGGGRVVVDGDGVPKVYASGWAATGAKGVIAATLVDAKSVGEAIVSDWLEEVGVGVGDSDGTGANGGGLVEPTHPGEVEVRLGVEPGVEEAARATRTSEEDESEFDPPPEIVDALNASPARVFTYQDWKVVDEEEMKRGREAGVMKERVKFVSLEDVRRFVQDAGRR